MQALTLSQASGSQTLLVRGVIWGHEAARSQKHCVVQFPGTTIPAELLNALPYMTNLQRLSLRSQQREVIVLSAQPLWIGSIEPILRCMHLTSLDMSYTDMNITLVGFFCKACSKHTPSKISALRSLHDLAGQMGFSQLLAQICCQD